MKHFYRGRIVSRNNGRVLFETTSANLDETVHGLHWLVSHHTEGGSFEYSIYFKGALVLRGNFYAPQLPDDFQYSYIGGGQLD